MVTKVDGFIIQTSLNWGGSIAALESLLSGATFDINGNSFGGDYVGEVSTGVYVEDNGQSFAEGTFQTGDIYTVNATESFSAHTGTAQVVSINETMTVTLSDGSSFGAFLDSIIILDDGRVLFDFYDGDINAMNGENEIASLSFPSTVTIETSVDINLDFFDNGYTPLDEVVQGSSGDDTIDVSYAGDPQGDVIDGADDAQNGNDDIVRAGSGNDSVRANLGNDSVLGEAGNDTLIGQSGNDTIYGDSGITPETAPTSEFLNWSVEGADEADISGGFTQNTGHIDVTVQYVDRIAGDEFSIETSTAQYVAGGEPFNPNSAAVLGTDGSALTISAVTLDFNAAIGAGVENAVENVSFRLSDLDGAAGSWQDIVVINAVDAYGDPVSVTITPSGGDIVSGNKITSELTGGTSDNDPEGSALVTIAGPVSSIEIVYDSGQTGAGASIKVTDVHFDTIPLSAGDDVLYGDAGDDLLFGEGGDDTIFGGSSGDTAYGGSGDDSIDAGIGEDAVFGGAGNDSVDGGDDADSIMGGDGADTLLGGGGDDTIFGGSDPATSSGGDETADLTFSVFHLGLAPEINTVAGNTATENPDALLGTYGSAGNELYHSLQDAVATDPDANTRINIDEAGEAAETITINGVVHTIDVGVVYNATVTFTDGTTGAFTAVVIRTDDDNLYLMPEVTNNADHALLTSKPIESIALESTNTAYTNISANRMDGDYALPGDGDLSGDSIDGGAGNDSIVAGAGIDTVNGGAGNDTIHLGDGADTVLDSAGDDSITGGEGKDRFDYTTITGDDTVVGGEINDTTPTDSGDKLDAHWNIDDITVTFTGDEAGTMTDGTDTVNFSEIEHVMLGTGNDSIDASASTTQQILDGGGGSDTIQGGSGDDIIAMGLTQDFAATDGANDTLVLVDGFGADSIEGFETPTDLGGGSYSGNDLLDVSGLTDAGGDPVNVDDVTVTDTNGDGTGDAILTFPNGESITLWGVTTSQVSSDAQLMAMGVPGPAGPLSVHDAIQLSGTVPAAGATLTTAGGDLV